MFDVDALVAYSLEVCIILHITKLYTHLRYIIIHVLWLPTMVGGEYSNWWYKCLL